MRKAWAKPEGLSSSTNNGADAEALLCVFRGQQKSRASVVVPGPEESTMKVTQPQPEPFINADEAAKFLSMSRLRVIRAARSGRLPAYSFRRGRGNDWFFLKSELAAHMRGELKLPPRPFVIAERKD
jgi:Helix-turn-helix domain